MRVQHKSSVHLWLFDVEGVLAFLLVRSTCSQVNTIWRMPAEYGWAGDNGVWLLLYIWTMFVLHFPKSQCNMVNDLVTLGVRQANGEAGLLNGCCSPLKVSYLHANAWAFHMLYNKDLLPLYGILIDCVRYNGK